MFAHQFGSRSWISRATFTSIDWQLRWKCVLVFVPIFKQEHLHRLLTVLQLPNIIPLSNGSVCTSEEMLLFSLHRMSYPQIIEVAAYSLFGRECSHWSRIFCYFLLHIHGTFSYLLTDNLAYWCQSFASSYDKMKAKAAQFRDYDIDSRYNQLHFHIALLCDCTTMETYCSISGITCIR